MAAPSQTFRRRRNFVFEGIPTMDDCEIVGYVVQLCAALEIIAYPADIEDVVPMRRRDDSDRPPPILISFAQLHIRSALLRRKYKLANMSKYMKIFINPDEPVEVRRAKAVFDESDIRLGKLVDRCLYETTGFKSMKLNIVYQTWNRFPRSLDVT